MQIVVLEEFTFLTDYTVRKNFLQNSSCSCQFKNNSDTIILQSLVDFYIFITLWGFLISFLLFTKIYKFLKTLMNIRSFNDSDQPNNLLLEIKSMRLIN